MFRDVLTQLATKVVLCKMTPDRLGPEWSAHQRVDADTLLPEAAWLLSSRSPAANRFLFFYFTLIGVKRN